MRLLLDTHALLWFYLDDPALSATAKAAILNPNNVVYVSPASYAREGSVFLAGRRPCSYPSLGRALAAPAAKATP